MGWPSEVGYSTSCSSGRALIYVPASPTGCEISSYGPVVTQLLASLWYHGRISYRVVYSPLGGTPMSKRNTRLTTPLVRENGSLRPATWDEALDRAAMGFRSAVEKHGPQTFGLFSCSKTTNEMNYLAQKFARSVVGSNNIDSCNRT